MPDKKELVKKADAMRLAKDIGCSGAHKDKDGNWMPCASMDELERLSNIAETSKWRSVLPGYKSSKERTRGRNKKRRRDGWEDLVEAPIRGIATLADGGIVSSPAFGNKSALGQSIGERMNGVSPSANTNGVDRDGDGKINDGTDKERSAPSKRPPAGSEKGPAEGKRPLPPPTPPKKRKRQKVYPGGRRYSRSLMPLGPDPENYPEDEYELITPDGKPYDRSKKPHQQGKSLAGPEYVRENDPDVFLDPESARARSRQMGCIGISRRVSKNGRTVWMPCTNMSDYANRSGSTALGRRNISKRRENETREAVRTVLREKPKVTVKRKTSLAEELLQK